MVEDIPASGRSGRFPQKSTLQTTATAADGRIALSDLGDGTYLLTVSAPGYASVSRQVAVTSGSVVPVEVPLQPLPGSLDGTVTSSTSGSPVADAIVVLGQWRAQTDANGHYGFTDLPPDTYALQVSVAGHQTYQASVPIARATSSTINISLIPLPGTVMVKVVDAVSGSPIGGATISYGVTGTTGSPSVAGPTGAGAADEQLCPDVKLLVPLKRSPEFAAIRRRVADPHHSDACVEDGLHFFVFQLHPAEGATTSLPGANGRAPGLTAAQAPVAVFAMDPQSTTPHSAVVVTPGPDGAEAEITDLREPGRRYTAPVA